MSFLEKNKSAAETKTADHRKKSADCRNVRLLLRARHLLESDHFVRFVGRAPPQHAQKRLQLLHSQLVFRRHDPACRAAVQNRRQEPRLASLTRAGKVAN